MKTKVKVLALLVAIMLVVSSFLPLINGVKAAEGPTTGKLTILKTDRNKDPIQDVEFTIYLVEPDADPEVLSIPQWYTDNPGTTSDATHYTKTVKTQANGEAVFDNLPLGRYLVLETDAPETVIKAKGFMVDIPMTNPDGTTLNYDVKAEPKNDIVAGTLIIEKQDKENPSTLLEDVTFKLQKYNESNGTYEDYRDPLSTDTNGQVRWDNLPVGKYKIVEVSTSTSPDKNSYGYLFDGKSELKFEVFLNEDNGTSMKFLGDDDVRTDNVPEKVIIKNEKPDFTKDISSTEPTKVEFKITVDVPTVINQLTKYKITDTMQDGLKYIEDTLAFEGDLGLVKETDYTLTVTNENKTLEIDFTEAGREKLYNALYSESQDTVKTLTLKYSVDILKGTESTKYENDAKLEYNTYTITDKETPDVGGLKLKKVDKKTDQPLQGAKFKLAKTESDAKDEKFIKGPDGNDIVLESAEDTGIAEYYGLSYGTYYLVEVESPLDEEGNRYNLLRKPVQVTVSGTSYSTEIKIENNKGLVLPLSGGIGALIFIVAGVAIISVAVVMRKKEESKE